jgi:hypothetical protein
MLKVIVIPCFRGRSNTAHSIESLIAADYIKVTLNLEGSIEAGSIYQQLPPYMKPLACIMGGIYVFPQLLRSSMLLFSFLFGFLHCTLGHSVAELVRGRTGEVRYFMRGSSRNGTKSRLLCFAKIKEALEFRHSFKY